MASPNDPFIWTPDNNIFKKFILVNLYTKVNKNINGKNT